MVLGKIRLSNSFLNPLGSFEGSVFVLSLEKQWHPSRLLLSVIVYDFFSQATVEFYIMFLLYDSVLFKNRDIDIWKYFRDF